MSTCKDGRGKDGQAVGALPGGVPALVEPAKGPPIGQPPQCGVLCLGQKCQFYSGKNTSRSVKFKGNCVHKYKKKHRKKNSF